MFVFLFSVSVIAVAGNVFADQFATTDQGMKDMLDGTAATPKQVTLTPEQIKAVNDIFKQTLIVAGKTPLVYTFYTTKDAGTTIIEKQMGKWGIITTMLLIGTDGKLKNLEVLSLTEKRGKPIVLRPFLSQFIGKGIDDTIEVGKTINGVTGATISSKAMVLTVKRALAVYNVVIEKNKAEEKK